MICRNVRSLAMFALLVISGGVYSQSSPMTPEEFLKKSDIALDNDSLLRALDDNRVGIAANAATLLAERGIKEAEPAIAARMKAAHDKQLVLTLAQSLNLLGSSDGTKQLEAFCLGSEVNTAERLRAAYALVDTRNYSCLPMMPELLLSSHQDNKQAALLYLLKIPSPQKNAPATLGPALLVVATSDPEEKFRALARTIINQIGDPATKDALVRSASAHRH